MKGDVMCERVAMIRIVEQSRMVALVSKEQATQLEITNASRMPSKERRIPLDQGQRRCAPSHECAPITAREVRAFAVECFAQQN
jgi:hypothetical protein